MVARRLFLFLVAAGALAACSEEDIPTGVEPTGPHGRVRFLNAVSTPGRAVNVRLEGLPFAANVAYDSAAPTVGARYYPVLTGAREMLVQNTADTSVHLVEVPLDIATGVDYTVIAVGPASTVSAVVLTDDNTAPATGQVRIRAVNVSPSTPTVDVYITSATADIAAMAPTVAGLAFKSAGAYAAMPSGTVRVRFTTAGTKTVIRDVSLASLAAGAVRTVALLDAPAGGGPLTSAILVDR
jgi:hypothetical protein